MVRKYAKLDMVPGGQPQRFDISEHDDRTRHLIFSLFASEGEFTMPENCTATLEGRLPSGGELKVNGQVEGYMVTFDLPAAAAAVAGTIPCNVVLTYDGNRLYSEGFRLVVDKDVEVD